MPAKPRWFQQLAQILDELRSLEPEYLDRQAVQRLFRVGERRARQIMAGLPALQVGNAVAVERRALVARLETTAGGDPFHWEISRRRRLAEELDRTRRRLAARRVRIPAASPGSGCRLEDLSPGITLAPGRLGIEFHGAEDLAAKLFELSQAMAHDWPAFTRALD